MTPRRPVPPATATPRPPRAPARPPARTTARPAARAAPSRDTRAASPRAPEARPPRAPRPRGAAGRPTGRGPRRPPVVRPVTMISGVLVIVALLVAPYVRPWLAQRSQLAQGRADVLRLEQEVARLQTERNRWDDPAYVEQQARLRLGLLRPGEVGYVRIDPTAPGRAADPRSAEAAVPPRHDAAWYGTLWQSVVGAGTPPPASVPPATAPAGPGAGTP